MKLFIMQSSPFSRHFLLLRFIYSPQHPVLRHPESIFLPWVRDQVSHPYRATVVILTQNINVDLEPYFTVGASVPYYCSTFFLLQNPANGLLVSGLCPSLDSVKTVIVRLLAEFQNTILSA